jgi:peptide/nickel transport system substrate-binding protein
MKKEREIHPAIFELKDDFEKGKLTRREFIRYAALLGMSVSMAGSLLGCAKEEK